MPQEKKESLLQEFKGKDVCIITADGRNIVGKLKGYDQVQNLIISNANERIFSETEGVDIQPLGLVILKGGDVVVVGELDADLDNNRDLEKIRAPPLKAVVHTAF